MADSPMDALRATAELMTDYVIAQVDETRSNADKRAALRSEFIGILTDCLAYFQQFGDPREQMKVLLANWNPPNVPKQ